MTPMLAGHAHVEKATRNADQAVALLWNAIHAHQPQETIDRLSALHDYYEGIARRAITGMLVGVTADSHLFAPPCVDMTAPTDQSAHLFASERAVPPQSERPRRTVHRPSFIVPRTSTNTEEKLTHE